MILWTIQTLEVYDLIQKQGYYFCDPNHESSCIKTMQFEKQYDWLVEKMKEKIGQPPLNIQYPVWAWYTYNWKHKKPDLRCIGLGNKGSQCVCMEIEIPDEDIVLSDHNSWHYILNNWHHNYSKNEEEWDVINNWLDSLPNDERQKQIELSWNNIFNIDPIDNGWIIQGKYIQATFWKLSKTQIRKIQFFKAR